MAGRLSGRPVSLSHAQFDWAREHGAAYWACGAGGHGRGASLVRIKNPAGRASTFTFDHGWLDIAEVDHESGRGLTSMAKIDITKTELVWPGK